MVMTMSWPNQGWQGEGGGVEGVVAQKTEPSRLGMLPQFTGGKYVRTCR